MVTIRTSTRKHPASDHQKSVARETILATRPWEKSTGPITARGKGISSQNARKAQGAYSLKRIIKSWEVEHFAAQCQQMDERLAQIEAECEVLRSYNCHDGVRIRASAKVERHLYADAEENRWVVYFVKCNPSASFYSHVLVKGPIGNKDDILQPFKAVEHIKQLYLERINVISELIASAREAS
jgi:hypothetical protein